jgi:hypothetical protein
VSNPDSRERRPGVAYRALKTANRVPSNTSIMLDQAASIHRSISVRNALDARLEPRKQLRLERLEPGVHERKAAIHLGAQLRRPLAEVRQQPCLELRDVRRPKGSCASGPKVPIVPPVAACIRFHATPRITVGRKALR